jgi:transketolase
MSEQLLHDCRIGFAESLTALAEHDERIVVVVNDSLGSSNLVGFSQRFPERVFNVGIAEANMVGVAAGLADSGRIPFVCGASCFLTARALEQIKVDIAYSNANVKLCGMSPGLAYGELGATHHSIEDVAWLRAISGVPIVVPADPIETRQAIEVAASHDGPIFVRVSRSPVPAVYDDDYRFELGKTVMLREGSDVTLISNGIVLHRALDAADRLSARDGIEARVLAMPTVKPIDWEAIEAAANETAAIVTIEEHTVKGGVGSAVAECVVSCSPVPMKLIGIPDVFAPTGSTEWLLEHYGLTASAICETVRTFVRARQVV